MTEYVYVAPAGTRTGRVKRYHTDETCRQLGDSVKYPAHLATGDGWRECKICAGIVDRSKSGGSKDIYRAAMNYND